ncbi:hypothetical protein EZV62_007522 [Acer yangbiense]|uniref:Orn/Lys/Arg decarboxylases family 1 pyridoxal-P attachment site domain-containing protein n=1 Tax=Acer yangbiense TaxID=1000413 RepID=A0A5C7IAN1_9ROSI|nr:hypothetical protein EZV62_007522 [Acer yangbiense]
MKFEEHFSPLSVLNVGVLAERSSIEAKEKQDRDGTNFEFGQADGDGVPPLVSALKASGRQNAAKIGNHFSPEGPIPEAQKQAAKLFGASETWFLVGGDFEFRFESKWSKILDLEEAISQMNVIHVAGTNEKGSNLAIRLLASEAQSTLCNFTQKVSIICRILIMGTCSPGDYLIHPRNSHKSAISSLVLSGAIPKYIIPEYSYDWDIPDGVMPSQVENAIKELEKESKKAAAVFVPSPTYHGVCSKLSEISEVCHNHGIPLIVDEAHGAHFGFSDQLPYSALQQGADLVLQSTHKVLCSLTQSSMLHLSTKTSVDRERISMCLQSLQTTSPNNLLLASLDAARAQLNENPKTIFNEAINLATETIYLLKNIPGISVLDSSSFPNFQTRDPLRLTLGFWQLGLSGYQANDILHQDLMVICELVGSRSLTFAFNLGTCREQIQRLVSAIQQEC